MQLSVFLDLLVGGGELLIELADGFSVFFEGDSKVFSFLAQGVVFVLEEL